jgi:hypothetical protein
MSRVWAVLLAAAAVVALAACGGSSNDAAPPTTTLSPTAFTYKPGEGPSVSAKMVCAPEAQQEIAATLGVKTTAGVVGQWNAPVYSCTYRYANGSFGLSVRELADVATAGRDFKTVSAQYAAKKSDANLGQGTSQAANGTVVVVKDNKVLVVDASGLPAKFGQPVLSRSDAALSVAVVIMGCWTGA